MRPVPQAILVVLLAALCGLCAVQWWRESALRETAVAQRDALGTLTGERDDLTSRMKAADAEILRLTAAFTDLRANSVSQQAHEETAQANAHLRESVEKQNAAIKEQNEAIAKQNLAVQQVNENLRKLAAERDELAKRVNEVTGLYNKLVQGKK
jgi:methyl-accepting chemotaxis protein